MKIVVLDGFTTNPGDLSWQALHALGDCTVYGRTPPDQTIARARGADIVLTNKVVLSRAVIDQLPRCRFIAVLATGYNVVDLDAARARDIPVSNVPAYSTRSVAQMVFAHILNITQNVAGHAASVRAGDWVRSEDFAYWHTPLTELDGKTLGIVGFGAIGRAVAGLGRAFGMRILVHTRTPRATADVAFATLDELFAQSDIVSLHCPLTPETRHLVNRERLARMKPAAILVNTGRGPLVDEAALAAALNAGGLAGAGLDVLSVEPPAADNPLLTARNCHITPHIAWATREARDRLLATAVANVRAFLAGTPQNVVTAGL